MAAPTYAQWASPNGSGSSLVAQTVMERMLSELAVLVSGQNPDATTFAGIPVTGGAPSGAAGGDLSGTYPNPTVAAIQGQAVTLDAGQLEISVPWTSTGIIAALDNAATEVQIGNVGPAAQSGITFQAGEAGANLYRSQANVLRTDDFLWVANNLVARQVSGQDVNVGLVGAGNLSGIAFQSNEAGSNLYRNAAGVLKSDGSLVVGTGATGGKLSTSRGIASGSLPAFTITASGQQPDTTSDRFVTGSIQNQAGGAINLAIQLSADNVTYTTVQTLVLPANTLANLAVAISVYVPAGWWLKASNLTNATALAGAAY